MKKNLIIGLMVLSAVCGYGQDDPDHARWTFRTPAEHKRGSETEIIFEAELDAGWQLYSSDFKADIGPLPTEFKYDESTTVQLTGNVRPVSPSRKTDRTWDVEYTYFKDKAEFRQPVRILKSSYQLSGVIRGQLCSELDGLCIPFTKSFTITSP